MQKNASLYRILSFLLSLILLCSLTLPAVHAEEESRDAVPAEEAAFASDETVRVSIVLKKPGAVEAGAVSETRSLHNPVKAYRDALRSEQNALVSRINALTGTPIEVKWQLTLAANIISANVRYGDLDSIRALPEVEQVFLETRYDPQTDEETPAEPNTALSSSYMVGASEAWAEGYTGAGSRVAIIDTGLDLSHQSVDAEAFQ